MILGAGSTCGWAAFGYVYELTHRAIDSDQFGTARCGLQLYACGLRHLRGRFQTGWPLLIHWRLRGAKRRRGACSTFTRYFSGRWSTERRVCNAHQMISGGVPGYHKSDGKVMLLSRQRVWAFTTCATLVPMNDGFHDFGVHAKSCCLLTLSAETWRTCLPRAARPR